MMIKMGYQYVQLDKGQPREWALTEVGVGRELDRRMTRVQMGARMRIRRRTGKALSSIRKNPGKSASGQYVDVLAGGRGMLYINYEHDGTRPHIIRPRRRKALRYPGPGGAPIFRGQVHHPGTTGTFFLTRALPLAAAE
jgi:hypothetical protein